MLKTIGKYDFTLCRPRTSVKQMQRCNNNVDTDISKDYYSISICIPFLDSFINNLEQKIENHKAVLVGFKSLLPIYRYPTSVLRLLRRIPVVMYCFTNN